VGREAGSVSFVSTTLGEFWYKLDMNGLTAEVEDVPEMTAEVGSRQSTILTVDNPVGEEVILYLVGWCMLTLSNPR
jgi:hypothetical protein